MATPTLVSISIIDATGQQKALPVYVPHTLTLAQLQTWFDGFADLLDANLDGAIAGATVAVPLVLPGTIKPAPIAGTDIERGLLASFSVANSVYTHSLFIPAWAAAKYAGDAMKTPDTDTDGLMNNIVSGALSVFPTDRYENDITGFLGGVKRFRK